MVEKISAGGTAIANSWPSQDTASNQAYLHESAQKEVIAMTDVSDYLAIYLGSPGKVPGIGTESGKQPTNGIGRYKSPHGSVRYVWYEHGAPLAVLQIVTRDGKQGTIANVYTMPAHRRQGLAAALLARSRRDFKKIEHAKEVHLSDAGKDWRAKLG
jgi:GNAT superfamily N-acetyltransferase